MNIRKIYIVACFVFLSPYAQCQQVESSLAQFHSTIEFNEGKFKGKGWDRLKESIRDMKTVFIGEDHGLAEIPILSTEISKYLASHGFDTYVGELGNISMQLLISKMKDEEHIKWLKANHFALPFVNWTEELQFIEVLEENGFQIYGIDQEFLLSPMIHFEKMAKLVSSQEAKEYFNRKIVTEKAAINQLLSNGNYLDAFLISAIDQDFIDMETLSNDSEYKNILHQLHSSFKVYRLMLNGNPKESNELRQEIMKVNFDRIRRENQDTKIIAKLGAVHCYKNNAPTGVEEIGEYVARQDSSFHLLVLGRKGTFNNFTVRSGFNENQKEAEYDITKRFPMNLSPFLNLAKKEKWSYFDLREIRSSEIGVNSEVKKMVEAFDALIIIPTVTASSSI